MCGATPFGRIRPGKLLRALRAFSLPVSLLPVVLAAAAVLPPQQWRWGVLASSLLAAAGLHLTGNLLNDYFDYRSGVDRRAEDPSRPGRLLVRHELLPWHVLAEALVCLGLGLGAAAYVIWRSGPALLGFAAMGLAIGYSYTGPPLALKYRRLGEPTIFVVFGPLLMTAAAWAQTRQFEPAALLLSAPVGLATTSILAANNFRDRLEDAQAGIRTLGQVADGRLARGLYVGLVLAGVLWLAGMGALGAGPRGLMAAPLTLVLLRKPLEAMIRGRRVADIDAQTSRFETILLLGLIVLYVAHRR